MSATATVLPGSGHDAGCDFVQASESLGIGAVEPWVAQALDRDGYVVLPGVIDPAWLEALRARIDEQSALEGPASGWEAHAAEPGTRRLSDLVNKGEVFDRLWSHPRVLSAVTHVIARPFKLSSLNYREPEAGRGAQGFHADWGPRVPSEPFHVCNTVWLLDDVSAANGGTRLVPGSHLLAGGPGDEMPDQSAAHPRQIVTEATAGSVLVFNSHLWHGGTVNTSGARRRNLFAYYIAREHRQQNDQAALVRLRTWRRLTSAQRWLLDV